MNGRKSKGVKEIEYGMKEKGNNNNNNTAYYSQMRHMSEIYSLSLNLGRFFQSFSLFFFPFPFSMRTSFIRTLDLTADFSIRIPHCTVHDAYETRKEKWKNTRTQSHT